MRIVHLLLLSLAMAAVAWSQVITAAVEGRITDIAGAPVSGAALKLVNTATGAVSAARTSADGTYGFPLLPPGEYNLSVQATGFTDVTRGFALTIGQTGRVDVTLTIGPVSQTVEVAADALLVESDTSSVGQIISSKQVEDLPLAGRNVLALAGLAAGMNPLGTFGVGANGARLALQMASANDFQANGGIPGYNEILLNGVPITVCCQGQPTLIPSVDVVAETKVQSNSSSAEFGRSGGGFINIVTKSGSNAVHGDAFEFVENDQLNAANFFVNRSAIAPIPGRDDFRVPLRYNQFGATLGAPVWLPGIYSGRNRTFFFVAYQGTRVGQSSYTLGSVPTAQMRTGNYSGAPAAIYDPLTSTGVPGQSGAYTRQAFPGNIVPASRFNPIAVNYLNRYFPLPASAGVSSNYGYLTNTGTRDTQVHVRMDHSFSERDRLFGYFTQSGDTYSQVDWTNLGNRQVVHANTVVLDNVYVFSPTLVVNTRYGLPFQRNQAHSTALGTDATAVGFPQSFADQQQLKLDPSITLTGFTSFGNNNDFNWSRYAHVLESTVNWRKAGHSIKFGYDGRMYRDNETTHNSGQGTFAFSTTFTNGPNTSGSVPLGQAGYDAVAAFLLGFPSSGSITYNTDFARQQFYHALYFQDDWRVTSRLTVNLGLRWDMEFGPTERYNRQSWFDPDAPTPLAALTGLPLKGAVVFSGVNGQPRNLWENDLNNFGPRAGFAYAITPRTVLRGAYSIFYIPTSQRLYTAVLPGYTVSTSAVVSINGVTPTGAISNPFPNGTVPVTGSSQGAMTLVGQNVSGVVYSTPMPYAQQWNFGLQRELPGRVLVSLTYGGGHSLKLPVSWFPNQLQPRYWGAPGDKNQAAYLQALVPNPFYGIIPSGTLASAQVSRQTLLEADPQFPTTTLQYTGQANSNYHSMQLTMLKAFSRGLTSSVTYTWSKAIGDANYVTTSPFDAGTANYQDTWNLSLERAVLPTDLRHRFVSSANYEIPFGRGKRHGASMPRALDAVIGQWQANGIFTARSGFPVGLTTTGGAAFAGSRPNNTSAAVDPETSGDIGSRLGGVSGGPGYLNAAAFSLPIAFQYGNVARFSDNIRSPGAYNIDFSMVKYVPVRENLRLQIRGEAFNLTNHPVFSAPGATFGSTAFGTITSQANSPRVFQLGLRMIW